jgi:hypothetical protein
VPQAEASRVAQSLQQRYGESNRDAMRRIFANVPVIYGFSSLAPLGAVAGPMLAKYFQSAPPGEIGSGRVSPALLRQFAVNSMTATSGLADLEPRARPAPKRASTSTIACRRHRSWVIAPDPRWRPGRSPDAFRPGRKAGRLARQGTARDTRGQKGTGGDRGRRSCARSLPALCPQHGSARDSRADDPPRDTLGWLSEVDQRAELAGMVADQLAQPRLSFSEVDLICSLNRDRLLDRELPRIAVPAALASRPAQSAVLACLGNGAAPCARTAGALQRRRLRRAGSAGVLAPPSDHRRRGTACRFRRDREDARRRCAVRALDTLAFQYINDRESLDHLARLFAMSKSLTVQRAIAGIFIRSDHQQIARPELVRVLQQYRVKSPNGTDMIDVLIRRLQLAARPRKPRPDAPGTRHSGASRNQ